MRSRKTVFVLANGCLDNRIDAASIREFVRQNGHDPTECLQEADVILFNACGLTGYHENAARAMIAHIRKTAKPNAQFLLGGCLSKIRSDLADGTSFGVDSDLTVLDELFEAKIPAQSVHANQPLRKTCGCTDMGRGPGLIERLADRSVWGKKGRELIGIRDSETRENVRLQRLNRRRLRRIRRKFSLKERVWSIKVSTGCLDTCSYCAVRLARGTLSSKPVDGVIDEFREGLSSGYRDFCLTGTDIGAYGRDIGTTLDDLLETLVNEGGEFRIALRNVHPRFVRDMLPGLRKSLASGKISCIISAAQSGNNRVLRAMKRRYTVEDLTRVYRALKKDFPHVCLRSQVIVGFPNETGDEFSDTIRLVKEVGYDLVEVYPYRPRPRTHAAQMNGHLPNEVIQRRFRTLISQCEQAVGFPVF